MGQKESLKNLTWNLQLLCKVMTGGFFRSLPRFCPVMRNRRLERNSQPKKNIKDTTILRTVESTKPPDLLVPKTQVCVVDTQWGQKYQSLEQRLVYRRGMQGAGWLMTPKPQPPGRVSARNFQTQAERGTWLVAANFLV